VNDIHSQCQLQQDCYFYQLMGLPMKEASNPCLRQLLFENKKIVDF